MADAPKEWTEVAEALRPHVSAEWVHHSEEYGDQAWVRLILLVDAHNFLSQPRVSEKVAMTLADLAAGAERAGERAGWEALQEKSKDERMENVAKLVDAAPTVLPAELLPLFTRSIEPSAPML